jgi:hypothetical protein
LRLLIIVMGYLRVSGSVSMGGGASTLGASTLGASTPGEAVTQMYNSAAKAKPLPEVEQVLTTYRTDIASITSSTRSVQEEKAVNDICEELERWYSMPRTPHKMQLIENFAHQVDIPEKATPAENQMATDVLNIVHHLQGKYKEYLQSCLLIEKRLPCFIEKRDTTNSKITTYDAKTIIPEDGIVSVGFDGAGSGSGREGCHPKYGLFMHEIRVHENDYIDISKPVRTYTAESWDIPKLKVLPSQPRPWPVNSDLIYIPLYISWTPDSGHHISMYYRCGNSISQTPIMWVFEPGGSKNMWAMIKGHVKTAINTFLDKYNGSPPIRFTEIDHGPRGQLGQLGGVTFRQELKGPVDVYVSQPPFMEHSVKLKASESKCLWACLRHFTWVATGVYDIVEPQERGFLLYQEILMALCAQVVANKQGAQKWIDDVTFKYTNLSRNIPMPLPAAGARRVPSPQSHPPMLLPPLLF